MQAVELGAIGPPAEQDGDAPDRQSVTIVQQDTLLSG